MSPFFIYRPNQCFYVLETIGFTHHIFNFLLNLNVGTIPCAKAMEACFFVFGFLSFRLGEAFSFLSISYCLLFHQSVIFFRVCLF